MKFNLIYAAEDTRKRWLYVAGLFATWFAAVCWMASQHIIQRDETRAFSLAISGRNYAEMLHNIHGEGHPALWYQLLRTAHIFVGHPWILVISALCIAVIAVLLLCIYSPFSLPVIALILSTQFGLYEYTVMARNYGISMLLMFTFAILYQKYREKGIALGIILALLANTNVHSTILAFCTLVFWIIDLCLDPLVINKRRAVLRVCVNGALVGLGAILCVATVYPTVNDGAPNTSYHHNPLKTLLKAIFLPSHLFEALFPSVIANRTDRMWHIIQFCCSLTFSSLLFLSILGLIKRAGAVIAAGVSLIMLSILFAFLYPGAYRHVSLWVTFLISLYWIVGNSPNVNERAPSRQLQIVRGVGTGAFIILLGIQTYFGITRVLQFIHHIPESYSKSLADVITSEPRLHDAILIADPDWKLDAMPYYIPNQLYFIREQRFGTTVLFSKKSLRNIELRQILSTARQLRAQEQKPVVIALTQRIAKSKGFAVVKEGFNQSMTSTPAERKEFLRATRMIASFGQTTSDETYDVYELI